MLDDITDNEGNALEQMLALVHFYFKEEPKDIDRLTILWNRLLFVLTFKGELSTREINIA